MKKKVYGSMNDVYTSKHKNPNNKNERRLVKSEDNIAHRMRNKPVIDVFGYARWNSKIGMRVNIFWKGEPQNGILYAAEEDSAGIILTKDKDQTLLWVPWHSLRIPRCTSNQFHLCNTMQLRRKCFEDHLSTSGTRDEIIERLSQKADITDYSHLDGLSYEPYDVYHPTMFRGIPRKRFQNICEILSTNKCSYPDVRRRVINYIILQKYGDINIKNFRDKVTNNVLQEIYNLYDKYFFKGLFTTNKDGILYVECPVKWTKRFKNGGNAVTIFTPYNRNFSKTRIEISEAAIEKSEISDDNWYTEGSIELRNTLMLIQALIEHEMVHVIVMNFCNERGHHNSDDDEKLGWKHSWSKAANGHSNLYMSILYNMFGHTDFTMLTPRKKTKGAVPLSDDAEYGNISQPGDLVYYYTAEGGEGLTLYTGTILNTQGGGEYARFVEVIPHRDFPGRKPIWIYGSQITQIRGHFCNAIFERHNLKKQGGGYKWDPERDNYNLQKWNEKNPKFEDHISPVPAHKDYTNEVTLSERWSDISALEDTYTTKAMQVTPPRTLKKPKIGDIVKYRHQHGTKKAELYGVKNGLVQIRKNGVVITIPWEILIVTECSERLLSNCSDDEINEICVRNLLPANMKRSFALAILEDKLINFKYLSKLDKFGGKKRRIKNMFKHMFGPDIVIQYPGLRRNIIKRMIDDALWEGIDEETYPGDAVCGSIEWWETVVKLYDYFFFHKTFAYNRLNFHVYVESYYLPFNSEVEEIKKDKNAIIIFIKDSALEEANNFDGTYMRIGGYEVHDYLTFLLLTFEHSLIHALMDKYAPGQDKEDIKDKDKVAWKLKSQPESKHSNAYMSLLFNIFGHTDCFGAQVIDEEPDYYTATVQDNDIVYYHDTINNIAQGISVGRVEDETVNVHNYDKPNDALSKVNDENIVSVRKQICFDYTKTDYYPIEKF